MSYRPFYVIVILLFVVKNSFAQTLYFNGNSKDGQFIQMESNKLLDSFSKYSPKVALEKLSKNTSRGVNEQIQISDSASQWYLCEISPIIENSKILISAFIPKRGKIVVHRIMASGQIIILRSYLNEQKILNSRLLSSDTFLINKVQPEIDDRIKYDNYLVSFLTSVKREKLLIRVQSAQLDQPVKFEIHSFPPQKKNYKTTKYYIITIFSLFILVGLIVFSIQRDYSFPLFFLVLVERAYSLRNVLFDHQEQSLLHSDYFIISIGILIEYILVLTYLNYRLFQSWISKSWLVIGLLQSLSIIVSKFEVGDTNGPVLLNNLYTVTIILNVILLSILIYKKLIINHNSQYYRLSFLLLLPYISAVVFQFSKNTMLFPEQLKFITWLNIGTFIIWFGLLLCRYYSRRKIEKERVIEEIILNDRKISGEVIRALEDERSRLAKDLHDELGNELSIIKMRVEKILLPSADKKQLLELIEKAALDTRAIAHNLMPPGFENAELGSILQSYFDRLNSDSEIKFDFYYSGSSSQIEKAKELIIYRIIKELIQNILRHANATMVTVQVIIGENGITLMLEDDGKSAKFDHTKGNGIKNIESRIKYLNGEWKIDSNDFGNTVVIQIPPK